LTAGVSLNVSAARIMIVLLLVIPFWAAPVYTQQVAQSWPDDAAAIVNEFKEYQAEIEVLRSKMAQTSLTIVSLWGGGPVSSHPETIPTDEANQWAKLMNRSHVEHVIRINNRYALLPQHRPRTGAFTEQVSYLHNYGSALIDCANRFRNIACGVCDVHEDGKWTIQYRWSSGEHEVEHGRLLQKKYSDDDLTAEEEEQGRVRYENLRDKCYLDGLAEMGYEGDLESLF